jgi:outer membrane protein OmpA-like peptidoglycan-associated protein
VIIRGLSSQSPGRCFAIPEQPGLEPFSKLLVFLAIFVAILLGAPRGVAQEARKSWSIGGQIGENFWLTEYQKTKIGFGAEVAVKYRLSRPASLSFVTGFDILKAEEPGIRRLPGYLRLTAFPASLIATIYVWPAKSLSPYFYAGAGALFFFRSDAAGTYYPDEKVQASYLFPLGLGVEVFTSEHISLTGDLGYRIIQDNVDLIDKQGMDSYMKVQLGFVYHFGLSGSEDEDEDGLTYDQERLYGTDPYNPDTDGDGLKDGEEIYKYRTDPLNPDTDGDGISDGDEVLTNRTDPKKSDTDDDGLTDGEEVLTYHTDPLRADTDGDGLSDGDEVKKYHTNPLKGDTDSDGLSDSDELLKYHTDPSNPDTDGGGVKDGDEIKGGTNPNSAKDDFVVEGLTLARGKTVILEGVVFLPGNDRFIGESPSALEALFITLAANPDLKIEIIGYRDYAGTPQFNDALSLRRAQTVKYWLVERGIKEGRLAVSRNPNKPLDPFAGTAADRALYRRMELKVQ